MTREVYDFSSRPEDFDVVVEHFKGYVSCGKRMGMNEYQHGNAMYLLDMTGKKVIGVGKDEESLHIANAQIEEARERELFFNDDD